MRRNKRRQVDGEWEVIVIRDNKEIEDIRPIWQEMQAKEPYPIINADVDRYLSVLKASGGQMQPYVILVKKIGHPVAMAIARVQKLPLKLKLGYRTLFSPTVRCLGVIYGGIIGQLTNGVCRVLVRELMSTLTRGEADMVQFNHLRIDSRLYELAKTLPNSLCRGYFPKVENHWSMSVPENLDRFYQMRTKKHRGNLKRYIRKLEKEYPNRTRVMTFTREDELDRAIAAASRISQSTYKHGLGCGFVDNSWSRILLTTAARQGWLRMAVLYIDEEPGAFQIGLHYRNRYLLNQVGFGPRWNQLNVGTVLFLRVLEDICTETCIEHLDFGFGDADYKRSYGDKQWQEASVYIFAPRLYPIFINMLRTSVMGLNIGLEYILNRTGSAGWVKRRWRNLLQVRSAEKERRVRR